MLGLLWGVLCFVLFLFFWLLSVRWISCPFFPSLSPVSLLRKLSSESLEIWVFFFFFFFFLGFSLFLFLCLCDYPSILIILLFPRRIGFLGGRVHRFTVFFLVVSLSTNFFFFFRFPFLSLEKSLQLFATELFLSIGSRSWKKFRFLFWELSLKVFLVKLKLFLLEIWRREREREVME